MIINFENLEPNKCCLRAMTKHEQEYRELNKKLSPGDLFHWKRMGAVMVILDTYTSTRYGRSYKWMYLYHLGNLGLRPHEGAEGNLLDGSESYEFIGNLYDGRPDFIKDYKKQC